MFNWDELRFFLAVHRHGTLAGAGASLELDPTTVGRRLNGLEARLETRLFDRTPRGNGSTTMAAIGPHSSRDCWLRLLVDRLVGNFWIMMSPPLMPRHWR